MPRNGPYVYTEDLSIRDGDRPLGICPECGGIVFQKSTGVRYTTFGFYKVETRNPSKDGTIAMCSDCAKGFRNMGTKSSVESFLEAWDMPSDDFPEVESELPDKSPLFSSADGVRKHLEEPCPECETEELYLHGWDEKVTTLFGLLSTTNYYHTGDVSSCYIGCDECGHLEPASKSDF